jgi:hypothetical protein
MTGTADSLRAIEAPEEIARLLALFAAAFAGKDVPARLRPRIGAPSDVRKRGFRQWSVKVQGLDASISLESVTDTRWRMDHMAQGALALREGTALLMRQWHVKRAPTDAALTAAEIAAITAEPPFYVTPGIRRGLPVERRLFQIVADLSTPPEAIRAAVEAAAARDAAAVEKYGFA